MRIQHNIMAMNAYRNYNTNTKALSGNLEKLSSGYKINRAGDDAAGLAISEKMRAQITGLDAAQKNVKDGISLVKTAEGAMQEIQDMLNRMDYLATQSANGTYQDEVDRENLQKEVTALKDEINRIADSANFNGIKLLDGSLAASGTKAATSIIIGGNVTSKTSEGAIGIYESTKIPDVATGFDFSNAADSTAKLKEGDSYEYTVTLTDGTSTTVSLTAAKDNTGALKNLVASDGTVYTMTSAGLPSAAELLTAVKTELTKTSLSDKYDITESTGVQFAAKEVGNAVPAVATADVAVVRADGERIGQKNDGNGKIGVQVMQSALDAGREIDASSITLYNGENYDDAVFTINGHKFVVATPNVDGDNGTLGPKGDDMNAAAGLGSDVTILVANDDTEKGLTTGDPNYAQNIAKIKEVTGLNVGDAIDEKNKTLADGTTKLTSNGIDDAKGIRLTIGKGTQTGGLTLQIGDTADSYNQMKVIVGDMHTKGMGIDGVDIGTQDGAAAAIQTIKDAINYVSSVRGDLGAVQNRLEHTGNNLSVMAENIQDAESTIRDTDVANEMMSYVKNNILVQSAQAMLAQANQVPQGVLQLLG